MLPKKYTQAVMFGEAIAGSIVALNRIITKGLSGQERTGVLIFFGISLLYIIACFGFQVVVWRSKFVRQYVKDNTSKSYKASEVKICRCLKRKDSNGDTRNESDEIRLQSYKDKDEMGAEHGDFINTIKGIVYVSFPILLFLVFYSSRWSVFKVQNSKEDMAAHAQCVLDIFCNTTDISWHHI